MNGLPRTTRADALIQAYMDGVLSEEQEQNLRSWLAEDAEHIREFVRQIQLDLALWDCHAAGAALQESIPVCVADGTQPAASGQRLARGQVSNQAEPVVVVGAKEVQSRRWWSRWLAPLAMAASLAIATGMWWFTQSRQSEAENSRMAGLVLRVAEVTGEAVIGDRLSVIGDSVPAVVGMELRQGDWVAVGAGGKVVLKYDGEATAIDLHSAVASFGAERGAKRVRLESGLLLCTVAPQAKPFRFETPHGVATVVGTRFVLDACKGETTLAVREGTVALSRDGQALEVKAGETAMADGEELRTVSSEEAWVHDLLIRAETGPWDVLDLGNGAFAQGKWRMDGRGRAAERLMWNVDPERGKGVMVTFDSARWRRGVLTGRIMILGDGTPAPVSPVAGERENPKVSVSAMGMRYGKENPIHAILYTNDLGRPLGAGMSLSNGKPIPPDLWQELVVYFDMDGAEKPLSICALWPDDGRSAPPASEWSKGQFLTLPRGTAAGFGLVVAPDCRVVVKGLKFVPLGAEMPQPPAELFRR